MRLVQKNALLYANFARKKAQKAYFLRKIIDKRADSKEIFTNWVFIITFTLRDLQMGYTIYPEYPDAAMAFWASVVSQQAKQIDVGSASKIGSLWTRQSVFFRFILKKNVDFLVWLATNDAILSALRYNMGR